MWMRAGVVLVVAAGCLEEPAERPTTLAGLGPIELDFWIFSDLMWLDVEHGAKPDQPCPVLGADFTAHIGDVPLSIYPGGMQETCNAPTNSSPCIPGPPRCATPFISIHDLPRIPNAVIALGDASRTIECKLGDAFVPRSMERVANNTWDVSPGETITVRWSPGSDLARFTIEVSFVERLRLPIPVAHVVERDALTFQVPQNLDAGYQQLDISIYGDVETSMKGCTAPNRRYFGYGVEQPIYVR